EVRRILEEQLPKELAAFGAVAAGVDAANIWGSARAIQLVVEPKKVPTDANLKVMQQNYFPNESLEAIADKYNKPETRSHFLLILAVDWDEEHQRWAYFRDDKLVSFSAE